MGKKFHIIVEQDEDGVYIGKVLELQGCVTQGETKEELIKNIKEAIQLCLEVQEEPSTSKFVEIKELEV